MSGTVSFEDPLNIIKLERDSRANSVASTPTNKDGGEPFFRTTPTQSVAPGQKQATAVIAPSYFLMVSPVVPLRVAWDLAVIAPLLVYVAIVLPFKVYVPIYCKPQTSLRVTPFKTTR